MSDEKTATKVAVAEATHEQLLNFARIALQIDVKDTDSSDTLQTKIKKAGFNGKEIPLIAMNTPVAGAGSGDGLGFMKRNEKTGKDELWYRIVIPEEEKPGGQEPVQVGVNGSVILLPRGKVIPVKAEYIEVLQNAVSYRYKEFDGERNPITGEIGGLGDPTRVPEVPVQYNPPPVAQ